MKIFFLFLYLSIFYTKGFSQNLVVNGSLEDENICTEYTKNCAPEGWMISTLLSNFYFDDSVNAYDGRHFIGMVSGGNGRYGSRNFLSCQLLCGLRPGALYQLQFFIRAGAEELDSVGVLFSEDDLIFRKWGIKNVAPDFWVSKKYISSGRLPWMQVNTMYQATGKESFINFALFKKNPPERYRAANNPEFSFFIDSISLVPLDPKEKLCPTATAVKEALYAQDERHTLLDRKIYARQRQPPQALVLPKTKLIRIDTLVLSDIQFATNSFALTKGAERMLDSFFNRSAQSGFDSIIVEGHTDNVGNRLANEKLSQNRAVTVAGHITSILTKSEPPIKAKGWADAKPVATNETAAGRQQNRRVEIYLYLRQ
jgi:outer membrane protein OmpA-like peptidoglycan-associated protein